MRFGRGRILQKGSRGGEVCFFCVANLSKWKQLGCWEFLRGHLHVGVCSAHGPPKAGSGAANGLSPRQLFLPLPSMLRWCSGLSPPWIHFVREEVWAGFWGANDSGSTLNSNGFLFCPSYITVSRSLLGVHIESPAACLATDTS